MNELVKQEKIKQEETNSTKMAPEKEIKRPIVCVICEKSFDQMPSLEMHFIIEHQRLKVFKCDLCENSFYHYSALIDHIKLYHQVQQGMTTKVYVCDKCEKEFQNISMFKQHTKDHQKQPKAKEKTKKKNFFVRNAQNKDLENAAERFVTIFKEEKQESNDVEVMPLPLHSNVFDKKELKQRYEERVSKWDDMMEKFKKYDEEFVDQYEVDDLEKWAKEVDYSTDEESGEEGKYNIIWPIFPKNHIKNVTASYNLIVHFSGMRDLQNPNQQISNFVIGKSEGVTNKAPKDIKGFLREKSKLQTSTSNFSLQRKDLKSMKWKELQKLKKKYAVIGNLSRDSLITAILEAASKIKLEEKLRLWEK